jgi:putative glutamine amidotransferase
MKQVYCGWGSWTGSFIGLFPNVKSFRGPIPKDAALVILPGGEDVDPLVYLENNTQSGSNYIRDMIEMRIFAEARQRGIPVFGVCRGHQLINAILGGSLMQHLPSEGIFHRGGHPIEWLDTKLSSKIHLNFVNSLHHQGYNLERCSSLLSPVATYQGIVEIAEGDGVFTTQFHPEMMDGKVDELKNFIHSWANL